jgi:phage terminase small subunit
MKKLSDEQRTLYDALTDKQKACVDYKLSNMGASNTVAYRMGLNRHDIHVQHASRLAHGIFSHKNVKAFLNAIEVETVDDMIMGREEILTDLSNIAATTLDDVVDVVHSDDVMMNVASGELYSGLETMTIKRLSDIPEHARKSIKSVKQGRYGIEITLYDAAQARKMIADMQGLNAPVKTELTGANGGPIAMHDMDDTEFLDALVTMGLEND